MAEVDGEHPRGRSRFGVVGMPMGHLAKHHALAQRLIDRQDGYLRFTRDPRVPFDNNASHAS